MDARQGGNGVGVEALNTEGGLEGKAVALPREGGGGGHKVGDSNIGRPLTSGNFGADVEDDVGTIVGAGARGIARRGGGKVAVGAAIGWGGGGIIEVDRCRGTALTGHEEHEIAGAGEREGGVERDVNPLARSAVEVALEDEAHVGTRKGVAACRVAELVEVGFGQIDTHVVDRATRSAAVDGDAVDAVVAIDAHLGQLLSGKDVAGVAAGVGGVGVECVNVAGGCALTNGVDNVYIVGAAIQQGSERGDAGPLAAVGSAEGADCPVVGGIVAKSSEGDIGVGIGD